MTVRVFGPEREGFQGLTRAKHGSGNRAILALLTDPGVRAHVDLVITCRDGAYEVWAERGMVRFRRVARGETIEYETLERHGLDPLADTDPARLATLEEGLRATGADHPDRCFFEIEHVSHPFAHERIAALFDSPLAPDLVVSPRPSTFGLQPGQHGALDVVQSRATLAFAGPRIRPGRHAFAARHVDVAPTLCAAMGFPRIRGRDALGRPADVYLRRQDGRVLHEILDERAPAPERAYVFVIDGLSHSELLFRLDQDPDGIPHLRRLLERAAIPRYGSIVNFPSITWPSHTTLLTGAWAGHHDVVNPAYYLRDERTVANPQGMTFESERFVSPEVETLYEAFRRVRGSFTAAINEPQGRGAQHASLERRVIADRPRLHAWTALHMRGLHPRWREDGFPDVIREAVADVRGLAQVECLFDDDGHPEPELVVHELAMTDAVGHNYGPHSEALRQALDESDARVGRVLEILGRKGLLETTLFVITSDHGMAPQDVSLAANPARHPERIGLRAITAEPMIWLRDLDVEIQRSADRRLAGVRVRDADPDASGAQPPVADATVALVEPGGRELGRTKTDARGRAALPTPPDLVCDALELRIEHAGFNPRHLTLEGRDLAPDPRALYRSTGRAGPTSRSIVSGGAGAQRARSRFSST
jgi:hypothetical protein